MDFRTARRDNDFGYNEIHTADCKHPLTGKAFPWGSAEISGPDAVTVAKDAGEANDGCTFILAPCARKGTGSPAGKLFESRWTAAEFGR